MLDATVSAVSVLPLVPFQTFAQSEIRYDLVVAAEQDARGRPPPRSSRGQSGAGSRIPCETNAICTSAPLAPLRLAASCI